MNCPNCGMSWITKGETSGCFACGTMRNGDGEIFPSKACHKIAEQAKRIAALEALLERARPMIDSLKEALHALEIPRENAEMKRVDVSLAIAHIKTALRQLEVAKKAEKAGEGKP